MTESKKTYHAVDDAIGIHVKDALGDKTIVVGWVVSVATKEVGGENFDSNGFAHFTSDSFPEYSQLGLLQTVLDDKRNNEMIAGIAGTIIKTIVGMTNNDEE